MRHFLHHTVTDLRFGRETWRVFVVLNVPAFLIAVALTLFTRF